HDSDAGARDGILSNDKIANDAAPAGNGAPTRFELRFHERNQSAAEANDPRDGRHELAEPDERRVDNDEVDGLGEIGGREVLRVGPLAHDDARIVPKRERELAVAYIDGVDLACAARKQAISEATGRGAHVDGDNASNVESGGAERLERAVEL